MDIGTIGRYEFKRQLGRGGMATVYEAYDPRFKRAVAIKLLPPQFLHDPSFRQRFEREAQTIASLEHPAIVPVYDFGEENDQLYLVMRLMAGGSLAQRIKNGVIPLPTIIKIYQRLATGLDAAHQKGLIHRDLKPANILFDEWGEPYIADFGIVKIVADANPPTPITATGNIIGTPAYMSPEQVIATDELDHRTDIYAMGVILYEMLTGSVPYHANTPMGQAFMHVNHPVPRILDKNNTIPPPMQTIVDTAMAKERDNRYASMATFVTDLNQINNTPQTTPSPSPTATTAVPTTTPSTTKPASNLPPAPPTTHLKPSTPPSANRAPSSHWRNRLLPAILLITLFSLILLQPWQFFTPSPTTDQTNQSQPNATSTLALAPPSTTITPTTIPPTPTAQPFIPLTITNSNCNNSLLQNITALDQQTVRFTLCQPDPAFLAKIALQPFGVYPQAWLEQNNGSNELLSNPIGTGPYQLREWDRGNQISYQRFDNYWGTPALAATAIIKWDLNSTNRLLALQTNSADIATYMNSDDITVIDQDDSLQALTTVAPNIFYIGFSNKFEPFNHELARRAFAMGIDRQYIVDRYYPEGAIVATHFTPCSIPNGCTGEEWYPFDIEFARELLAEAGYDQLDLTIYYRDVYRSYLPNPSAVAQDLAAQLTEYLAIDVTIEEMDANSFLTEAAAGNLDGLYLLGWPADYPHITNFLDFHFGQANPQFGTPHADIYNILETAKLTSDPAEQTTLYTQANNQIKSLVPMIPIAHTTTTFGANANLLNAYNPTFGSINLAQIDPQADTLTLIQTDEPFSLYCNDETTQTTFQACAPVTETLYRYQNGTGILEPALATNCTPNDTFTIWTCTLRPNVQFHDGSILTANDVITSWDAAINTQSPLHTGNSGQFQYMNYLFGTIE
ncbi:MAG TPA: ABC transporter substrate-binding protein [Anaerolineae bacterium]|nr:ABC transporter substrate-binding protein [Anaerolineae bacterium]